MNRKILLISLGILAFLFLASVLIFFISKISFFDSLKFVFAAFFALFLPGLVISYAFFPLQKNDDGKKAIDGVERITLSFALSIASVSLTVFYLNLAGMKINFLNSLLVILGIIVIGGIFALKDYVKKK